MKIRMLTHYRRAADGINVRYYDGGKKYDLPDAEAELFIKIGVAVEDKEMPPPEVKWVDPGSDAPLVGIVMDADKHEKKPALLRRRRK